MVFFCNSNKRISQPVISLISGFAERGCRICLSGKDFNLGLDIKKCEIKNIFLGPSIGAWFGNKIFIFLYPWLFLSLLINFFIFFRKNPINTFVLLGLNEKMLLTPIAKILKIKIIWLEDPEFPIIKKTKFFVHFYKYFSKWAKIVTFFDKTALELKMIGVADDKIFYLAPGVVLDQYQHQANIFSSLAKAERSAVIKKYFTIGTVTDYKSPNQLESLFQAIKIALNVAPNIQLVIIGDGPDRKKYLWIARKLEIGNLTWFVGEQKRLRKWLEDLDLFVSTFESANLNNAEVIIKAMASNLPVCGFRNPGFENILDEKFFVEMNDKEALAREIIYYFKDKQARKKIGAENIERAKKHFDLKVVLPKFEELLEL